MNEEIKKQIDAGLATGAAKEAIFAHLLTAGYKVEDINRAFAPIAPLGPGAPEETEQRTVGIMVTIGAVLIGLGIFSFVAANWEYLNSTLKVVIILLAILLVNVLAWYLKEKKDLPKAGSALFILGSLIYGAGIFLIAQIFNIRENWPDGFMLWMIGVVLMAFAMEEFGLFYIAGIVGLIAIVGHPFVIFDDPLTLNSFALTPSFLLILATVVAAGTGYLIRKKISEEQKGYF